MRKILVYANCAVSAYGFSMATYLKETDVTAIHIGAEGADFHATLAAYDIVLTLETHVAGLRPHLAPHADVIAVPSIHFSGYHPDCAYIGTPANVAVANDVSIYHSALIFAAFEEGLTEAQALRLFEAPTFAELGYFAEWEMSKRALIDAFGRRGIAIDDLFLAWTREAAQTGRPFMYTMNHARAHVICDIARRLCETRFGEVVDHGYLPLDPLAQGPGWACYPPIAEALGVHGETMFKAQSAARVVPLPEFIALSYACYDKAGPLRAQLGFTAKVARAREVIAGRTHHGR